MLALAIEFSRSVEGSHPQDRTVCHDRFPTPGTSFHDPSRGLVLEAGRRSAAGIASGLTGAPAPTATGNRSPMVAREAGVAKAP